MKYCDKCKASVVGGRKYCPLCQSALRPLDDHNEETFPFIPTIYRQHNVFIRLIILASIAAGVISVVINILIPQSGFWSVFVVLGIICMWISLAVAVRKRSNVPKSILYQVVLVCLLAVFWDFLTKWHGWSIDYVIPIVCVCAMSAMAISAKILGQRIEDYIIYLLIDVLFSIVPVIFIITGCLHVLYPSLICVAASIISFATLLLFDGEHIRQELRRRLHM